LLRLTLDRRHGALKPSAQGKALTLVHSPAAANRRLRNSAEPPKPCFDHITPLSDERRDLGGYFL
jgi:hypothetical protein